MRDSRHHGTSAVIVPRLTVAVLLPAAAMNGCAGDPPSRPAVRQVLVGAGQSDDVATGFSLGPERLVTVAHLLGERRVGARVEVQRPGPHSRPDPATIVTIDERADLAVLAVPGLRGTQPHVDTATGDAVLLAVRDGRLQALPVRVLRSIFALIPAPDPRVRLRRRALQLRGDVRPGDSGAPVLSADGSVAGIIFARSTRQPGIAYAVDARALAPFLRQRSRLWPARSPRGDRPDP